MANNSNGNSQKLSGKKLDIVTKYLADQMSLESHIYQAIDKQVKATQDEPDVNPSCGRIAGTFEQHTNALKARIEALGGQATSPVKEAGAAVLGVAAGVIDKVRPKRSRRTSAITIRRSA